MFFAEDGSKLNSDGCKKEEKTQIFSVKSQYYNRTNMRRPFFLTTKITETALVFGRTSNIFQSFLQRLFAVLQWLKITEIAEISQKYSSDVQVSKSINKSEGWKFFGWNGLKATIWCTWFCVNILNYCMVNFYPWFSDGQKNSWTV